MGSLKRVFRPEFVNRVDSVIVFRSLNLEDIKEIVVLELNKVAERLSEYEVLLDPTPAALEKLAELGYDPDMGARPLKRIIQQKVEDQLSDALLSGLFGSGDTILVDVENDDIVIRKKEKEEKIPESSSSPEPTKALPTN